MHIVLSSHLLRDVEECCDEVLILKDGRVAALSNLEEERKTNKKFLELETAGAAPAFTEALEQAGCECASFGNGKFRLILPEGIQIKQIYEVAAAHDIEIRRMNYRRDSLEDIFLKAMQPAVGASASGSL
jgi:ABC-2 type transport system ATP-binding protein